MPIEQVRQRFEELKQAPASTEVKADSAATTVDSSAVKTDSAAATADTTAKVDSAAKK